MSAAATQRILAADLELRVVVLSESSDLPLVDALRMAGAKVRVGRPDAPTVELGWADPQILLLEQGDREVELPADLRWAHIVHFTPHDAEQGTHPGMLVPWMESFVAIERDLRKRLGRRERMRLELDRLGVARALRALSGATQEVARVSVKAPTGLGFVELLDDVVAGACWRDTDASQVVVGFPALRKLLSVEAGTMLVEHRDTPMRASTIMAPLTEALDIARSRFDLDSHTERLSLREQAALRAVALDEENPPLAHSTSVTAAFDMPEEEALETGDLLVMADDTEDEAGADDLLERIDLESATKVCPPPIPDEARFVPFPPEPTHVELPPGILDAATEIETSGVFITGSRQLPARTRSEGPLGLTPAPSSLKLQLRQLRTLADQWLERWIRRERSAVIALAGGGVVFGVLVASIAIAVSAEPEPVVTPLPPLPVRVTSPTSETEVARPTVTTMVVTDATSTVMTATSLPTVDPACVVPADGSSGRRASQALVRRARRCEGAAQGALLHAALAADEDNPHAVVALARHHVSQGSLESAEEAARRAVRLRPRRAQYRLLLGDVLLAREKTRAARRAFEQAVRRGSRIARDRLRML